MIVVAPHASRIANAGLISQDFFSSLLNPRDAELLLLRADDFSYNAIAQSLGLNSTSVGTLLSRAQQAFRKEYVKQYGPRNES
jgi:DNA-directed RNA polymerase specialized sigma24 family protein